MWRCGDVIKIVVSRWLAFKAAVCYGRWAVTNLENDVGCQLKEQHVGTYCVKCA